MHICPKCKSGNVTIKTSFITEYHDAEIKVEAKITMDNDIVIKFRPEGSYYLNDEEGPVIMVCENGHETKFYDLDEELINNILKSISVHSEDHTIQHKLEK